jgi:hypothetical protein
MTFHPAATQHTIRLCDKWQESLALLHQLWHPCILTAAWCSSVYWLACCGSPFLKYVPGLPMTPSASHLTSISSVKMPRNRYSSGLSFDARYVSSKPGLLLFMASMMQLAAMLARMNQSNHRQRTRRIAALRTGFCLVRQNKDVSASVFEYACTGWSHRRQPHAQDNVCLHMCTGAACRAASPRRRDPRATTHLVILGVHLSP